MKNTILKPALLLLLPAVFACQPGSDADKSIASTHPKLEQQLARDSVATPISSNENPALYDQYRITLQQYETSGAYAINDLYGGKLSPLDEASHNDIGKYKTLLHEGLKQGINFAGKYTVVRISCGTHCQEHYVVDRQSGKVLDKIQSRIGAKFSPNSRLFILNPPSTTVNYNECPDCAPQAYIFEDGKFRKVATPDR